MTAPTITPPIEPTVTTETIETIEESGPVTELANRVADGRSRLVLERGGKAVAAVVSLGDLERLRQHDERSAELWRNLVALAEPFKDLSPEEIQREVDRAIAESRAKRDQAGLEERGSRSPGL